MKSPFPEEHIRSKPWTGANPPKRVLVIRLQAMGDCAITIPAVAALRKQLPASTRMDLVTRRETAPVARAVDLYNKVYALPGGRNGKKIFAWAMLFSIGLWWRRYEVVVDLQRNRQSRILRRLLRASAWSEIERFSPTLAVSKYQAGINAAGFPVPELDYGVMLRRPFLGDALLKFAGWQPRDPLVVLNPAGLDATRNWPLERYVAFAKLWMRHVPGVRFVVMGYAAMRTKALLLAEALPDRLIDLTGQTTVEQAMTVLRRAQLMLTEDSGLMHMAWVQGVPTLALFGASRYDWSRPVGEHSHTLCALDLDCIGCLSDTCMHGDIRCMMRHTPEQVAREAKALLTKLGRLP